MYMSVRELNEDQLNELKWTYFYQLLDEGSEVVEDISVGTEIPNQVIFDHYDGISFVDEDFCCTSN